MESPTDRETGMMPLAQYCEFGAGLHHYMAAETTILKSPRVRSIPKSRAAGRRFLVDFDDEDISRRFARFEDRVMDKPPDIRELRDVYLDPLHSLAFRRYSGGAFANGERLAELALRRSRNNKDAWQFSDLRAAGPTTAEMPREDIDVAWFGGYLFSHYGHFLLEGLTRILSKDVVESSSPIVFFNPQAITAPRGFMTDIFAQLGISKERIILFDRPIRVRTLLAQDTTYQLGGFVNVAARAVLQARSPSPSVQRGLVYLSRNLLKRKRKIASEGLLEAVLSSWDGASIMHPETIPIGEQLARLSSSAAIGGCEGSAFYTRMFLGGARTSIVLCGAIPDLDYFLQDELVDGHTVYVNCAASIAGSYTRDNWPLDADKAYRYLQMGLDIAGS